MKKKEKPKTVGTFRKDFIYTALALIAVGVLFVVLPKSSATLICYITAGLMCVWGIIKLMMYLRSGVGEAFGSFGLVTSVSLIIGGIAIFINPEFFAGVIATIFGCAMIVDGVLKVQYAIDLSRIGGKYWWVVLIVAAVFIAAGLIVVFNPFFGAVAIMAFLGVALIVDGISDLITASYVSRVLKNFSKLSTKIDLYEDDYKDID
ncbi:MAG: HdeD family acid-resistance protein [Ruminococcus sp.]